MLAGYKISERHKILYNSIGVHEEEIQAYHNVIWLMVVSFLLLVFCSTMEIIFFCLYNNKMHPFKNILIIPNGKGLLL